MPVLGIKNRDVLESIKETLRKCVETDDGLSSKEKWEITEKELPQLVEATLLMYKILQKMEQFFYMPTRRYLAGDSPIAFSKAVWK